MVGLGTLSMTNQFSRASGVSADGSVIVGSSNDGFGTQAFRWTAGTGMVGLTNGPLGEPFYGTPNGISSDGSTIFGQASQAWIWKEGTGFQFLGTSLSAYGSNVDGSIIVGGEQFCCSNISFIWDAVNGPRNLKTVLQNEYGLDLTGWTLKAALDISDDGSKIVGVGINPLGYEEAWYTDLAPAPVPLPASFWLMLSGIGLLFSYGKKPIKVMQA
jgi:probable HAF family extracellular repeat protein